MLFAQSAASAPTSGVSTVTTSPSPAEQYGLGCLAPALVAIFLAIATRQVVVALSLGIFTASAMLCVLQGVYNPLIFVTTMMEKYVLGVLAPAGASGVDREHLTILVYTFFIGATVGVLGANGGTRGLVARVTRRIRTRQSAQLGGIFAGLFVFLDDYASAMVVGPGLRPIFDRLRISREKLAHIVNWTAAPDSSIFLSTWLAVQISNIDSGFKMLGDHTPAFLAGQTGSSVFWTSIPYRTYTILVLVTLVLLALTGRDFGAMRKAESRAASGGARGSNENAESIEKVSHWSLAAIPAFVFIALMVGLLAKTGYDGCHAAGTVPSFASVGDVWPSLGMILGKADSHFAIFYAAFAGALVAIVLSVSCRALSLTKTMEGAITGMKHTFAATIILVLAWGLSQASRDLQLDRVAAAFLKQKIESQTFSVMWLPMSTFVTACILSFSTGTSWGTMAILVPSVVSISGGLLAQTAADQAMPLFLATVGSTMAGAVFGNTCSPLADVTVLSAMFSECDTGSHVRTIFPYALFVGVMSLLCTDGARMAMERWSPQFYQAHWNVWYGLALGALLVLFFLLVVGRRPKGVVIEPAVIFESSAFTSGGTPPASI